jgi:hypothetical protein
MIISGLGLLSAIGATLWFFAGFFETDPGFSPASAAFLLSLGLGAFAIIPCAVIVRLSRAAWKQGFQTYQGVWTLILCLPWLIFAGVSFSSDWLPLWLSAGSGLIAGPCSLWAIGSLIVQKSGFKSQSS